MRPTVARMTRFGYTLMTEQSGPRALVDYAVGAERAGYDFLVSSDHYSPWLTSQGHAPYAWTVLGAVAHATSDVELMTYVTCPTVREADGLAMSSRNVHLSPEERDAATVLRRALVAAREAWAAGERSGDALRSVMRDVLATEPLANVEYVSVADDMTLQELSTVDRPALASLAVRFGETRLIDNVLIEP